jgi:hypothetical protein
MYNKYFKRRNEMKKQMIVKVVVVFAVLTATGIGLVVFPLKYAAGSMALALPIVGGGIFSATLAFFLVEMFRLNEA